jgi:hypothetical protein
MEAIPEGSLVGGSDYPITHDASISYLESESTTYKTAVAQGDLLRVIQKEHRVPRQKSGSHKGRI